MLLCLSSFARKKEDSLVEVYNETFGLFMCDPTSKVHQRVEQCGYISDWPEVRVTSPSRPYVWSEVKSKTTVSCTMLLAVWVLNAI